jgi:hypothetical protein
VGENGVILITHLPTEAEKEATAEAKPNRVDWAQLRVIKPANLAIAAKMLGVEKSQAIWPAELAVAVVSIRGFRAVLVAVGRIQAIWPVELAVAELAITTTIGVVVAAVAVAAVAADLRRKL